MNVEMILKEMHSPATKELMNGLCSVITNLEDKEISHQQGAVEIAGYKHAIQDLALDWTFGRKSRNIKRLSKQVGK